MQGIERWSGGNGLERGIPNGSIGEIDRAEIEEQRLTVELEVLRFREPFLLHPLHRLGEVVGDLVRREFLPIDHELNGAILITDGKLHAEPATSVKQGAGGLVNRGVISGLANPVPVGDDPINSRQLHLQEVTLKDVRVGRIIQADQRMILGPDIRQAVRGGLVGVMLGWKPRPMAAPFSPDSGRHVPGHVVHYQGFSAGLWCGYGSFPRAAGRQRQSGQNNGQPPH